jgi:hypothetical protein
VVPSESREVYCCSETASSLTLRRGEGQEDVVLRQDIEEMKSSGVSLMPDGLEKNIPIDAMPDLIAFLKGWRFIDAPERERRRASFLSSLHRVRLQPLSAGYFAASFGPRRYSACTSADESAFL